MATITSTRTDYKNAGDITDAQCVRIVRKDGEILRFTNSVNDLVMSDYVDSDGVQLSLPNDVTYISIGFNTTATHSGKDMSPGTVDLEGVLSATNISRNDLKKGLYNQARIYVFYTNYNDPVEDDEKLISGFWGEATVNDGTYSITFNSLIDVLNTRTGKSHSPTCTARLGDDKCGVRLTPPNWSSLTAYTVLDPNDAKLGSLVTPITQTGFFYICTISGTSGVSEPIWPIVVDETVNDGSVEWTAILHYTQNGSLTSVVDRSGFVDTDRTEPDDWWTQGKIIFTSGANEGMTFDIKQSFLAFNSISVKQEAPFDFEVGDTYIITTGCRKRLIEDCIGEFKNVYNNQSSPWIPGRSVIGKFGGQ
jgi:uncharacterized phage protein (TIGR02218 family)